MTCKVGVWSLAFVKGFFGPFFTTFQGGQGVVVYKAVLGEKWVFDNPIWTQFWAPRMRLWSLVPGRG